MNLFVKGLIVWFVASIVLTGLQRIIYIFYIKKKNVYNDDYDFVKMDNFIYKNGIIKINLIKGYLF